MTHPVKAPVKAPAHVAQAVSAKPVPSIIEVGNVPGCVFGSTDPQPYLDTYHATVLRIIVTEGRVGENPLPCIEMAVSEGFHVHVALQWDNHDTPSHVAAYISSELNAYGSLLWAVSLGNEQELAQGGVGATARQYADDWQAAEPVVANLAPNAIRVAGDISPWALSWIEQAWTDGLPGAQALGAHPYQEPPYAFTPGQFLGFAQATGLPAWFDEGLAGPHAWDPGEVLYASAMSGAQLAGVWWDGTKLG